MTKHLCLLALGLLGCASSPKPGSPRPPSPAAIAAELIATDSAFAAAAQSTNAIDGLSAMLSNGVTMPAPGGRLLVGRDSVIAYWRANPDQVEGTAAWTPIRVGISGDGQHGFTFGYGTVTKPDSTKLIWKYLTYWIKEPAGWRVVVYRRSPRAGGSPSLERMPAALPAAIGPGADSATVEGFRASLDQAERGFSDEAQRIGLRPAFAKWGRPDAVNMGGPALPEFVISADSISRVVGSGADSAGPSSVSWGPNRVIVSASGDLGVTIGLIRPNKAPPPGGPTAFAFFTVWYRESVTAPWRYIAE